MRAPAIALIGIALVARPGPLEAQCAEEKRGAAMEAYGRKDYLAALRLLEEAIAAGQDDPSNHYDAACCAARAGRKEQALFHLDASLAQGFSDCRQVGEDPDLEPLRAEGDWTRLLSRCEATRAAVARFWDGPAWKAPYSEELSAADRIAGLSRIWSEARFNFANFELVPDLDWDQAYRDAIPKVLAAATTADTYVVFQEFIALLRDGHTSVQLPRDLRPRFESSPALGTRVVEGHVVVADVYDSRLVAEGLRPGLEITAVNGVPVRVYGEGRIRSRVVASTPQDLEVRVYERALLEGPEGTSVSLTLLDENGVASTKSVPRLAPAERARLVAPKPLVVLEPLPGGIAHLTIRSFNDARVVPEFEKLLEEIRRAKGLVLDIRGNGGGNSTHGDRILTWLTRGSYPSQRWWTRDYRPAFRAWGMPEGRHQRTERLEGQAGKAYEGPIALLVGPRTYSAAEDFTAAFRAARRGPIVGERTGGSTGQPLRFALPGGGIGQVCTKRNTLSDGTPFVGIGIQPDVVVPATFADARAGRDAVLEAAVRILQSRAEEKTASPRGSP